MVSLLAAVACERKPHDLVFDVRFVCPEDQAAAETLELRVLEGGCDGSERVYEASLSPGELAPVGNGIDPGRYGFQAVAFRQGEALASGCVEATLPTNEVPSIALRSDSCNEAVLGDAGQDAAGSDNGDDAGDTDMDADTLDAGSRTDAEPETDADAAPGSADASTSPDADADADPDAGPDAATDAESQDVAPIPCATDCKDSFPCTEDRCVNGECVHEPYTGMRECDGVACTQSDRCENGSCVRGTPNNTACPDDGNPCTAETCEPATGCNRQNASSTTGCDDRIGCTGPDRCNNGTCRGADMCTSGVCSAASRMCVACTAASGATDCDDKDPCTTDACSAGSCTHTRNVGAMVCDDNKSCTTNDACTATGCAGASTCPASSTCGGTSCRCNDSAQVLCEDKSVTPSTFACANLSSDAKFCGSCDRRCPSGASCQNSACKPEGASCTAWRYNGHDYLVCSDGQTWTAARDKCKNWGLVLAIIDSLEENNFLRDKSENAKHWIAANDRGNNGGFGFLDDEQEKCTWNGEEGRWYWASNSDDNGSGNASNFCNMNSGNATTCSAISNRYQNWSATQPDNAGCKCRAGIPSGSCDDGEDCGELQTDGTWNDDGCGTSQGYICETP